jgi:hypothetical protein
MQTRKILLSSDLRTSGGGKVRVYGDAWMKVSIGANASLNISMNE